MQSTAQANEETEVCATSRVLQSCARTPSDTSAILTPGNAGEPLLRAQHRRQHTSEVHLPFHQSYGNSRAGSRGHVQHNNAMDRFCSPQHPTRLHSAGCSSLLLLLRPLVRLAISTPNTDVFPSLRTPPAFHPVSRLAQLHSSFSGCCFQPSSSQRAHNAITDPSWQFNHKRIIVVNAHSSDATEERSHCQHQQHKRPCGMAAGGTTHQRCLQAVSLHCCEQRGT